MSRGTVAFLLAEAEISLYPALADGSADEANPLWLEAVANGVKMRPEPQLFQVAQSGAEFAEEFTGNIEHIIEMEKTWALPKSTMVDFVPVRNAKYVLQFKWHEQSSGLGHQRTYFGVTARQVSTDSRGVLQFDRRQVWRAERMEQGEC